jgi:hypothetical protein
MLTNVLRRIRKPSTKQLVIASAFVFALAGAVGLGLSTRQTTHAADCTPNAVLHCGTPDANNFINRVQANEQGTQGVYDQFGLQASEYQAFRSQSKQGIAYRDGTIKVDGVTVATDAWSIGRTKKSKSWNWNGFWADTAQNVNNSDIPVMVMFNDKGEMDFAVMYDCGNPTTGKIVRNDYDCKSLTKTEVQGEKDTYMFTVDAPHSGNVSIAKVVYTFGDGTTETRSDLAAVKHKFTKPGNYQVTVSVTFNLPGGKQQTVTGNCKTNVTIPKPFYACVQVIPTALNDKKTQFRFAVKTNQGNGATLKDVDFTLDGSNTTTGVTTKDDKGMIYKDYTFAEDGKTHEVVAKVNFNVADGVQSDTCKASVTSTKPPMCDKPGKENFPPNAPECQDECKPGIPKGDAKCEEVLSVATELPNTGMGSLLGLFAGTSAAGAVAHRVVTSRRQRRELS